MLLAERYWYWFRSESDGKLLGIPGRKFDWSMFQVGIMVYETFANVFNLIRIFIYILFRSFVFFFAKVCILIKFHGCKECGYINSFF